jgi:rhomboid protease GluP
MSNDIILFCVVCLLALAGLVTSIRRIHSGGRGWAVVLTLILVVNLTGGLLRRAPLVYAALAAWLLLVLIPAFLVKLSQQRLLQQRYGAAYRLARILRWLHPADGLWEQPKILNAIHLAEEGHFDPASEILKRYETSKSQTDFWIVASLYRATGRWEDMLAWEAQRTPELERASEFLPYLLRARGETGDVAGLVELYSRQRNQITKLPTATLRDLCRLMLFSFTGKRKLVENHLTGSSLRVMPLATQKFWLATADLFAGQRASAKEQLESWLKNVDLLARRAIERRLAQSLNPQPTLNASSEGVIDSVAIEQSHRNDLEQSQLCFRLGRE